MATRPVEYQNPYIIRSEVAYEVQEPSKKGTQAGIGNLNIGRVVWVSKSLGNDSAAETVSAYAEGIGVISVNPQLLSPVPVQ